MSLRSGAEPDLNANLAAQFETALLICGDRLTAENVLLSSVAELDLSDRLDESSLLKWRHSVVTKSIEACAACPPPTGMPGAAVLSPGLRQVVRIDPQPRICFVLRLLLGYSKAACAELLQMREDEVGRLLVDALVQLRDISEAGLMTQVQKERSCQTRATST